MVRFSCFHSPTRPKKTVEMSTEDCSESQPKKDFALSTGVLEDTLSNGGDTNPSSFENPQESKKEDYENSKTQSQGAMVKSRSSPFLRSSQATPIHQSRSFEGLEGLDSRKGKNVQEEEELPSKDFKIKRIEQWVMELKHCSLGETEQPTESDHDTLSHVSRTDAKALPPATDLAKKHVSSLSPSATAVHLANRGLVAMPFLSSFSVLKVLDLSGNAIVRITAGALPRGLHILNLSKNGISTIEGLRELTRLRVLDLSYNRILRIGHGLASCSSLKELYLAGNKISEVEGLHRLLKLNVLDLRFNKLSTTKSLAQLAANHNSLQAITLEGNPAQKNVGDESLKKHLAGLLPHLAYFNRHPIRAGTIKDAADRAARLGISAHLIDPRGLRYESKSKSKGPRKLTHGQKGPTVGSVGPGDRQRFLDSSRKVESLRPESGVRRSRSEGLLGTI